MRNEAINDKSMKKISEDISSISISMIKRRQNKKAKVRHIDEMADRLVRIYSADGADNSRQFFLKCYWYLDERFIDDVVEKSKRPCVHAPLRYFISSCHNEMLKIGI